MRYAESAVLSRSPLNGCVPESVAPLAGDQIVIVGVAAGATGVAVASFEFALSPADVLDETVKKYGTPLTRPLATTLVPVRPIATTWYGPPWVVLDLTL